jgi:hypothetical protein
MKILSGWLHARQVWLGNWGASAEIPVNRTFPSAARNFWYRLKSSSTLKCAKSAIGLQICVRLRACGPAHAVDFAHNSLYPFGLPSFE